MPIIRIFEVNEIADTTLTYMMISRVKAVVVNWQLVFVLSALP